MRQCWEDDPNTENTGTIIDTNTGKNADTNTDKNVDINGNTNTAMWQ